MSSAVQEKNPLPVPRGRHVPPTFLWFSQLCVSVATTPSGRGSTSNSAHAATVGTLKLRKPIVLKHDRRVRWNIGVVTPHRDSICLLHGGHIHDSSVLFCVASHSLACGQPVERRKSTTDGGPCHPKKTRMPYIDHERSLERTTAPAGLLLTTWKKTAKGRDFQPEN